MQQTGEEIGVDSPAVTGEAIRNRLGRARLDGCGGRA
jgi:hypothetical protein